MPRVVPFVLACALVGCTTAAGPDGGEATPATAATAGEGAGEAPETRATTYAAATAAQYGAEEAFVRTWLALDAGYSIDQVLDGAGDLQVDGRIAEVEPAGPPLGLFQTADGEPLALAMGPAAAMAAPEGRPVVIVGADETLEDLFRRRAAARPRDFDDFTESSIVALVIPLLQRGYSPQQVIEALIVGSVALDRGAVVGCYYIDGVTPEGEDTYDVTECPPVPAPDEGPLDALLFGDAAAQDDGGTAGVADATYEGLFDADEVAPDGGRVLSNGIVLELSDEVAQLTGVIEVADTPTFIGSGDRVLCVADLLYVIEASPQPVGSDAAFELLATLSVEQGPGSGEDCDGDDEPSTFETPVTLLVTLDVGVAEDVEGATVEIVTNEDQLLEPIRLGRTG